MTSLSQWGRRAASRSRCCSGWSAVTTACRAMRTSLRSGAASARRWVVATGGLTSCRSLTGSVIARLQDVFHTLVRFPTGQRLIKEVAGVEGTVADGEQGLVGVLDDIAVDRGGWRRLAVGLGHLDGASQGEAR